MLIFKYHFVRFTFIDLIDVIIVAIIFYNLFSMMRGTRAQRMILGLGIILLLAILSEWLQMTTMHWLISRISTVWVIAFIIVFQPELRDLLSRIGQSPMFAPFVSREVVDIIPTVVDASFNLGEDKIGALIVIEREVSLKRFADTGKVINAKINSELIQTIFTPHTPLHDGAVIISGQKIVAAGAMLPLSLNPRYERFLGTRHRAGIGVSEQTDAIAIVVSEETGKVSLAIHGGLRRNLTKETLSAHLSVILAPKKKRTANRGQ